MRIFLGSPVRGLFLAGFLWVGLACFQPGSAWSEEAVAASNDASAEPSVYAVYGVNDSADFLPDETRPVRRPMVEKRRATFRSPLELPDIFYVIAVPVFLVIFIIVLMEMLKEMPDTTDTH